MAVRSGFFNSVNGDRKYDARRFAEYFASFIGNGVFPNPSTNLQVLAQTTPDMTVIVRPGKAWINGYILINDDDYVLQLDPADGVLHRIDRVVARYDVEDREIRLEVKKGTFASAPEPPALQRDTDAYELGLADIYISKGAISISQSNITDLRLNKEYCGIVHGLVDQVDTTTLFNQYQAWINEKKDEFDSDLIDYKTMKQDEIDNIQQQFENDFNTWFATIQDILDENVAGNLLNLINANTAAISTKAEQSDLENLQQEVSAHKGNIATEERHGLKVNQNGELEFYDGEKWNITAIKIPPNILFDHGDHTSKSGGWHEGYARSPGSNQNVFIQRSDHLYLFAQGTGNSSTTGAIGVDSGIAIDLSPYNTLKIEWEVIIEDLAHAILAVNAKKEQSYSDIIAGTTISSGDGSRRIDTLDISNLNDFYYISIYAYAQGVGNQKKVTVKVWKVWLEE